MNAAQSYPMPKRPEGWAPADENRFRQVFARIIRIEGGFVDDKADKGGATKYGVSLRFAIAAGSIDVNRDGFKDLDLNLDGVIDGRDIRALTPEIAETLYLDHFWIRPGIWTLPMPIDAAVFDQAVNGGTTAAIKILQRACGLCGVSVDVDGSLGPETRRAVDRAMNGGRLLDYYRQASAARYKAIVAADPSQGRFLNGWLRRAQELGRV